MVDNTSILYRLIGEKIKDLRELKKDSQLDLSKKIEISRSSISNIESGRQPVSIGLLYEIAQVYESDLFSLLPSVNEYTHYLEEGNTKLKEYLQSQNIGDNTRQQILNLIK